MTTQQTDKDALREQVRARYAAAAAQVTSGQGGCGCGQPADCGCDSGCCGPATVEEPGIGAGLYPTADRAALAAPWSRTAASSWSPASAPAGLSWPVTACGWSAIDGTATTSATPRFCGWRPTR
jgi:hypothetical protein